MADPTTVAVLVGLAAVPALFFLVWMRNREAHNREPYAALLSIFAYGATVGIVVAFLLNTVFDVATWLYTADAILADRITAVITAPFVEEAVKATGFSIAIVRRNVDEWEDGIVYGAAVGLGFAMSENLLYGFTTLSQGTQVAITVLVLRVPSAMVLHAGASAIVGHGIAQAWLRGDGWGKVVPYYLLAVVLHALYNLSATAFPLLGFLVGVTLVWVVLLVMRKRVQNLETPPHRRVSVMAPGERGRQVPPPARPAAYSERPREPSTPPHERRDE